MIHDQSPLIPETDSTISTASTLNITKAKLTVTMNSAHNRLIVLADTKNKGRGVFATRDIPRGKVVINCPYIVLGQKSSPKAGTDLEHYVFRFPYTRSGRSYDKSSLSALVLGEASLLHHSDDANCTWQWDVVGRVHQTVTVSDIREGEELTIFYGWDQETWHAVGGMRA